MVGLWAPPERWLACVVRVGHLGVEPSCPRVSGGCRHRLAHARCVVGPGGVAPPSPGLQPGACAVSATASDGTGRGYCPHYFGLEDRLVSVNTCPAWLRGQG